MAETAETAEIAGGRSGAKRLGFSAQQIVQEFGYDSDVDHDLREAIEEVIGSELLDEDADEVVDGVILWWRDGDGDLVDTLVDTLGTLAAGGTVLLLTPKPGRPGQIDAADLEEAAPSVGLHATKTLSAGEDWMAIRLVPSKAGRRTS